MKIELVEKQLNCKALLLAAKELLESCTGSIDYLYNAKEVDRAAGTNWSFYGFRMYDPTIGRFTGVDPIADQFAWANPFNCSSSIPVLPKIGVETVPGFTALILIFRGASSVAAVLVYEFSAALVAAYTAVFGIPV